MREDDILLTLAGVRVLDTAQLWTALAMLAVGDRIPVAWLRDGEVLDSVQSLGGH